MKNNKMNRVLAMLLIIFTLFSTSSSVKAVNVYTFKPGNNTIQVNER